MPGMPQRTQSERIRRDTSAIRAKAIKLAEAAYRSQLPPGLEKLTLDATLGQLPLHKAEVDIGQNADAVMAILQKHPELPGVIVTDKGKLVNLLCRRPFFELLGRPFGVELYLHHRLSGTIEALQENPIILPASQLVRDATQLTLKRPTQSVYDPIVIQCLKEGYRILDAHALLLAQSVLLSLTHQTVKRQLFDAANYVMDLLPQPLEGPPISACWRHIPSYQLGGDAFGYKWLDDTHFSMFLLDVSGHGIGPALLSVSALQTLQSGRLSKAELNNPAQVLTALNELFPSGKNSGLFFTIWYGVYDISTRTLVYASAGHPPAFLLSPRDGCAPLPLRTPGMPIGVSRQSAYQANLAHVSIESRLCLYSDGCYELIDGKNNALLLEDFRKIVACPALSARQEVERLEATLRQLNRGQAFRDDFSLLIFDLH